MPNTQNYTECWNNHQKRGYQANNNFNRHDVTVLSLISTCSYKCLYFSGTKKPKVGKNENFRFQQVLCDLMAYPC